MNEQLVDYFQFLDDLRESGITNMYGAAPYLQDVFDLTPPEARDVLGKWMRSKRDKTPEERAKLAAR
jgi:hypothetical protein